MLNRKKYLKDMKENLDRIVGEWENHYKLNRKK